MKNRAFTLIELLVVVLIIGILAAIAVPQYQKAVYKSRFAELVLLNNALVKAQKLYFLANNKYATDLSELDIDMPHHSYAWCQSEPSHSVCWLRTKTGSSIAVLEEDYIYGNKYCCAYKETNFIGEELCQLEMNNTEYFQGCGNNDGCHCYTLK